MTAGVRFAPSPTGRFHLGNLRTAWISREWARALKLPWVLRFEDIDAPRVLKGAMETQLEDMRALGLEADEVRIQSQSEDRHRAVFEAAVAAGTVYPCSCSRKEVAEAIASAPHGVTPVYSGACRDKPAGLSGSCAWRFKTADPTQDFLIGRTIQGKFLPAYHWACAIDDYDGAYPLLVRAWDLDHVVGQHRQIHAWLRAYERTTTPFPAVFHTSLVTANDGHRLEKRTQGVTLPELLANGWTVERLLARFQASYVNPGGFAPEKLWGEPARTLTLEELGL